MHYFNKKKYNSSIRVFEQIINDYQDIFNIQKYYIYMIISQYKVEQKNKNYSFEETMKLHNTYLQCFFSKKNENHFIYEINLDLPSKIKKQFQQIEIHLILIKKNYSIFNFKTMNLKKYKKILFYTFSLDFKKISNFGRSIYSVINILSKRSDHLDIYLNLLLNMKFKLFVDENSYEEEEEDKFEEFVTNKGKIKLSKTFEKKSKPTSIAIIEYLQNELYFIYLKKIIYKNFFIKVYINKLLKKLIKKILKKEKKKLKKKKKTFREE